MFFDIHTHFSDNFAKEIEYRVKNNIKSIVSVTKPNEIDDIIRKNDIYYSIGLHPWFADKYEVFDMIKYFDDAVIIGEIGLDSVWCDVDLEIQRKVFIKQLENSQNKPIILHTKGQEKEVLEIIKNYKNPIKIVHWYSCFDYIDDYINEDCYFTISADLGEITTKIIEKVPINRLLVETDGIKALEWVLGREVFYDDIKNSIINSCKHISKIKGIDFEEILAYINENSEKIIEKSY